MEVKKISINGNDLSRVNELNYLGITIISGSSFKINTQKMTQKYYRALNAIFGKVGGKTSPLVLCSLVQSFCVPLLLYGAESVLMSQKNLSSLEYAYNMSFMKIFKTYDKVVVSNCQLAMGYLPLKMLIDLRKLNFLCKVFERRVDHVIILVHNEEEFASIGEKYALKGSGNWKLQIMEFFKSTVNV